MIFDRDFRGIYALRHERAPARRADRAAPRHPTNTNGAYALAQTPSGYALR